MHVSLGVWLIGCGPKGGVEPRKIDVAAQIAGLQGDVDAKTAALSELAAGGPNSVSAVPQIAAQLNDPDPVVRRLAAYALDQVGPGAKSASDALKKLLQDPDNTVAMAAVNALRTIDPSSVKDIRPENVMPATSPQ